MTGEELKDYVFRRMPIRTRMLGRERLAEIVDLAVARWPSDGLRACARGSSQEEELLQGVIHGVGQQCSARSGAGQTYGFVWMFLMSAVISAVVQAVLRWWLEREANRQAIALWKLRAAT